MNHTQPQQSPSSSNQNDSSSGRHHSHHHHRHSHSHGHQAHAGDEVPPKVLSPVDEYCKRCSKVIAEGRAFELGEHKWHVDCFRCSKCSSLLGIDSEFLVVGNGDLVCNKCYYDCQICGKVIDDMAIIAGGQPFCSSCFVCKLCRKSIDNIRYARTSNGLYCMNCHDKIERKKKKYELKKKRQLQKLNTSSPTTTAAGSGSMSSPSRAVSASSASAPSGVAVADHLMTSILSASGSASSSKNASPVYEKSLPSIPAGLSSSQLERQHASIANFSSPFESEDKSPDLLSPMSFDENNEEHLFNPDNFSLFTPVSATSGSVDPFQQAKAANSAFSSSNPGSTISTGTNNITQQMAQYTTTRTIPKLSTPPASSGNIKKPPATVSATTSISIDDNSKTKPPPAQPENSIVSSSEALRSFNSNNSSLNEIPGFIHHASTSKILNPTAVTSSSNLRATSSSSNNSSLSSSASSSIQKPKKKEDAPSLDNSSYNNTSSGATTFPQLSKIKEEIEHLTNTKNNLSLEVLELSKTMQKLKMEIENERQSLSEAKQYNKMLKNGGLVSSDVVNSKILDSSKNRSTVHNNGSRHYSPLTEKFSSSLKAIKLSGSSNNINNHEHHHRADSYESFDEHSLQPSASNPASKSNGQMIHSLSTSNILNSNSQTASPQQSMSPKQHIHGDESSNNLEVPKPKSKRFWRNKGFFSSSVNNSSNPSSGGEILDYSSNDDDDDEYQYNDNDTSEVTLKNKLKISGPVVSHQIDKETFELMKQQNQNGNGDLGLLMPSPAAPSSGTKIGFLDKFSMAVGGSSNSNDANAITINASQVNISAPIINTVTNISSPISTVPGGATTAITGITGITGATAGTQEPPLGAVISTANDIKKNESLTLIEKARQEKREVPLIVTTCFKYVERYGLNIEGIYRKSGSTSQIQQLEMAFDNYAHDKEELERCIHLDIHVVSSVLKRYLRRLKEPLIPYALYDEYIKCGNIKKQSKKVDSLKTLLKKFPKEHYLTLTLLCKHLNTVAKYSDVNLMNLHNLSIVFAPSLARDLASERDMIDMANKNDVTEFLVTNYKIILT